MSTEETVAIIGMFVVASSVAITLVGIVAKDWVARIRNKEYDSARMVALDQMARDVTKQTVALQTIASTLEAIYEIEAAKNINWPEDL